jgi:hypothetical protein
MANDVVTETRAVERTSAVPDSPTERSTRLRRWLPDFLGLGWVLAAAAAVMAPALSHGWSLGPFDQLNRLGLSQRALSLAPKSIKAHNPQVVDLIRELIPWTTLAWTQVHNGMLPLWNPYSSLGAPLAFNWQSATFSLPNLIGYLFPVRLDFTVQVLITLVIGGTGAYVLARVMRIGVLGAAMAATAFELSGSFMAVLGWPIASVMSWAGWMFALVIMIIRGGHRRRDSILFAIVVAWSVYAGEPDALIVLVVAMVVFVAVVLTIRARRLGSAAVVRSIAGLVVGSIAGLGLAAPLILPAGQLTAGSVRGTGRLVAFPAYQMLHLAFQTFDGSSTFPLITFDNSGPTYVAPAGYIGIIAIVLAVIALVRRRNRPGVVAFGAVVLVSASLVYLSPLVSFLNALPGLGEVRWVRALQVLVFAVAILAGVGLDVLVRSDNARAVRNWLGAGFGAAAVLLLLLWIFGRGHLPAVETSIRSKSFRWPAAEVVIGLAVFGFLVVMARRQGRAGPGRGPILGNPGRTAGAALLLASTILLVVLGSSWWSSSTTYLAPTPAEVALQKAVGTSMVGFGTLSCWSPPTLGIQPEVNIVYGVHELDSYDPLTPQKLYQAWVHSTGLNAKPSGPYYKGLPVSLFCPVIETTAAARQFGVGFVLEKKGIKGPAGSVFDRTVGNEELYRIPGSSLATLTPLAPDGSLPAVDATGAPLKVTYPNPASWNVTTDATTPQVLRLRLTDIPGWHATIDGKPLVLSRYNLVMLQAKIPPGQHTVELHYWPDTFTAGIAVAVCTVIGLVLVAVLGRRRSWGSGFPARPSVSSATDSPLI